MLIRSNVFEKIIHSGQIKVAPIVKAVFKPDSIEAVAEGLLPGGIHY